MSVPKKKNPNLSFVKLKSTLKKTELINSALLELKSKVDDLTFDDPNEPSFIKYICELIENISTVKLTGSEKLSHAINLIIGKFPVLNNEKDIDRMKKQINDFVANGDIKKVSAIKRLGKSFLKWSVKKLI